MFVTSQGSAYGRFRRSVASRELDRIRYAALELSQIGLVDALRICEAMREDEHYERAAVRWVGRFALEVPPDLPALTEAAAALTTLPQRPEASMAALVALCRRVRVPGA
jgi:hypothetical protein